MSNCKSYVRGQQIICDQCGMTWDLNDEPPECKPVIIGIDIDKSVTRSLGNSALLNIKENLNRE